MLRLSIATLGLVAPRSRRASPERGAHGDHPLGRRPRPLRGAQDMPHNTSSGPFVGTYLLGASEGVQPPLGIELGYFWALD